MKCFLKIFYFLFAFLLSCEQKTPPRSFSFSIIWEWQAPQHAFIQNAHHLGNYVFLTLNTGEIAIFPIDRPQSLQLFRFPETGLISITWLTNVTNEFYGVAWLTRGNNQQLLWFSTSISFTNSPSTNQIIPLSSLSTLTYTKIDGIDKTADILFWAADGLLFSQDLQQSILPTNPSSIPFSYPFRIWSMAYYQHILYLAQGDKGLTIVDLKRKKVTNYQWFIGAINSLFVLQEEKKLILADRINGIRAYSIRDPWTPSFVAVYETLGNTMDISHGPSGIWVADQYHGISLLKFHDQNFSLITNIQGRVVSRVHLINQKEKLLFWHQDKILLTTVSAP